MLQRQTSLQKAGEVKQIKAIFLRYRAIGIANLYKVRASQLQEIRKKLEGTAHIRVIKNSLTKKTVVGFEEKPNIEKLREYLEGSNLFIFTNVNPFRLALALEKSKVKDFAKAGDIATEDIMVSAGNTGLPPGPIISQLNAVGIPTRIDGGSVWVNRDTVVVKKGGLISENHAPVLSKLGIKPIEMGLFLKVVYDDGLIIGQRNLSLNLQEYRGNISEASMQAMNLALNAAYPLPENISTLIHVAISESHNLAVNASILTAELMPELIRKAYVEAMMLHSRTRSQSTAN